MLDAVETAISALRSRGGAERAPQGGSGAAVVLQAELRAAGISAGEFARIARIPQEEVESWTVGDSAPPEWAAAAVRLVALLTPSARRKLLHGPAAQARPADGTQSHPFSRIEEL